MNESSPADILHQIALIQRMEPGKLCVIRQGPNGPYYNLQCRENGKNRTRYVAADEVAVLAEHTANFQRFEALVEQYAKIVIDRTRAERAGHAKKNTSLPKSTSRKTKKSSN